jgi:membrane-bound lytic murein transglycosylase D
MLKQKPLMLIKILLPFLLPLFLLLGACANDINNITPSKTTHKTLSYKTPYVPAEIEPNLWNYISQRTTLKARNEQDLYWHLDWFKKHPNYLTRITKRATPYLHWIVKEVERVGVPIEIALLPIVESAYYPFSYSHGTASGLWQFIPSTGKLYGLKQNYWADERRSIIRSSRAAISYLKSLNKLFKGDWLLAIASYNSGPGRVLRAIEANKKLGKPTDFWHIDLPKETRGYVPRLLAVTELIKNPVQYNQRITSIPNHAVVSSVLLDSQLDLALIAQWTNLSLNKIYQLNPDLNHFATPNIKNYELLLPIKKINIFRRKLATYPRNRRLNYVRYQIQKGDSLNRIAKKFDTSVSYIKNINKLSSILIKTGDSITIPIPKKEADYYQLSEEQREAQRLNSQKNGIKTLHTVKEGDSLWLIARQYNSNIKDIIRWNHLSDGVKSLPIGKQLLVYQIKRPTPDSLKKLATMSHGIKRTLTYSVNSKDNLSTIAKRFKLNVADIVKENNLDIQKILKIGQTLKLTIDISR